MSRGYRGNPPKDTLSGHGRLVPLDYGMSDLEAPIEGADGLNMLQLQAKINQGGHVKAPVAKAEVPSPTEAADPFDGLVVGRMVYYWPWERESRHSSPGPWAAIVTKVDRREASGEESPDGQLTGVVTLNVQMPTPTPIGSDPVQRFEKVPYSVAKAEGSWSWMFDGQAGRYKPDRTA